MISDRGSTTLSSTDMSDYFSVTRSLACGAILYCQNGTADLLINFTLWHLDKGSVFVLFPGDVIMLRERSNDFYEEVLAYSSEILREASLQIESTVYSNLRLHRLCTLDEVREHVVTGMFSIMHFYFNLKNCTCLKEIVTLQLKVFFIGFYDYIIRCRPKLPPEAGSQRINELFNSFMQLLEREYSMSHSVAYYAQRLCITPKYLGMIVARKTKRKTKDIIDEYLILQLKLSLSDSVASVKQISHNYNFSDVAFFCRYFKQHTGVTPQQYRSRMSVNMLN